ncbi:hypothetical protein C8Q73DRAFT_678795 [Cubamyces lactineus]|nr:hypothetical protein C8Q73DRAFT_678795 [Cubamyces lactineus]
MTANVQPQLILRFLKAMQSVYGPLDALTPAQASSWTPPPMAEGHRGRYLWTDAFGVLNLLTLSVLTSHRALYATLAARLVQAVHDTLGRTRDGTARLLGASDAHPLAGGLRIGKEYEEDDPDGDGDGQYHHYLTMWMFALNRMGCATGERRYNDLAIELAKAIHPRFVYGRDSERPRMYWKMSVDLQRPMVRSEGNLDPIDGYVVFSLLQRSHEDDEDVLAQEIEECKRILETKWRRYASDDPLDLGMTLWTAHWFDGKEQWATELSRRAATCLRALCEEEEYFDAPTRYRLAFREFGTCLGVRCLATKSTSQSSGTAAVEGGESPEKAYWEAFVERVLGTWAPSVDVDPPLVPEKLQPITLVMYAAALIPGAFRADFFGGDG